MTTQEQTPGQTPEKGLVMIGVVAGGVALLVILGVIFGGVLN